MDKELEEAKEVLGAFKLANIIEIITQEEFEDVKNAIETVLRALDNSIPKEKVEDKIEIYKLLEMESFDRDSIQADEYRAIIKVLQELLEK